MEMQSDVEKKTYTRTNTERVERKKYATNGKSAFDFFSRFGEWKTCFARKVAMK